MSNKEDEIKNILKEILNRRESTSFSILQNQVKTHYKKTLMR